MTVDNFLFSSAERLNCYQKISRDWLNKRFMYYDVRESVKPLMGFNSFYTRPGDDSAKICREMSKKIVDIKGCD